MVFVIVCHEIEDASLLEKKLIDLLLDCTCVVECKIIFNQVDLVMLYGSLVCYVDI